MKAMRTLGRVRRATSRFAQVKMRAPVGSRAASAIAAEINANIKERGEQGLVAKALIANEVAMLVKELEKPEKGEEEFLMHHLANRIPPGVDDAAYVKASWLAAVAKGEANSPLLDKTKAVELLGTMQGGYNVAPLVEALDNPELAATAATALKDTLLVFDAFYDVETKGKAGNAHAKEVMESWANAEWFLKRPKVAEKISVTVFKVTGETNTDDLSPAPDAWSRPDIPLHALAMLKIPRDGILSSGDCAPVDQIEELKKKGLRLPTWATWSARAPPARARRTPSSGLWETTSRSFRTSARAACASAARSPRSSSTPWRTPAPSRLRSTSRR
jgi:aconitase B